MIPTSLNVCVVCQQNYWGQVEQFLEKFRNGMLLPQTQSWQPFEQGFLRKYRLKELYCKPFFTQSNSVVDYLDAAREALDFSSQAEINWDLAIIQTEEGFEYLYGDNNPYLALKSFFLSVRIPVQAVELETIQYPDTQLPYALNSMGLASFAKIGGIPWLLRANSDSYHELVIGMGSAIIGRGRFGDKRRVVGITSVFSSDGNYYLSDLSRATTLDKYKNELLSSLRVAFARVEKTLNWQPNEQIRLIFHSFKPLKNEDVEAVKIFVDSLNKYRVDYAFVHVVQDHPYILFDPNNKDGKWDYTQRAKKGIYAPTRGNYFNLGRFETLISLTGASEVKRPQDGIPHPVLLRLHRNSTFTNLTYLTEQVFAFSCHSWRSFFPSPLPVTIQYSQLIAKQLGLLETVSGWNSDILRRDFGNKRWFL